MRRPHGRRSRPAKDTSDLESNLGFLRTFLLVFAYVALVSWARSSSSTRSRSRSRSARASSGCCARSAPRARRSCARSIYEGLLLGVVRRRARAARRDRCSRPALDQLFKAFGADLPDNGTVLETRTIVVSLLVGVGVTRDRRASRRRCARRACRRSRRCARASRSRGARRSRAGATPCRSCSCSSSLRLVVAIVQGEPLRHDRVITRDRLRAARTCACASARTGPRYRLTRGLAHGDRERSCAGAASPAGSREENSIRQPGRTLITAAALTVGLALVTFVAVLADGTKATIDHAVEPLVRRQPDRRELAASTAKRRSRRSLAPALRSVPGVATVTPIAFTVGRLRGEHEQRDDHRDRARNRSRASTASNGSRARTRRCSRSDESGHDRHEELRRIAPPEGRPARSTCSRPPTAT